jgi:hypothetical protein
MLATPSSSSYVLVDDVCARLRAVEELGFVDRDGIVDRLRAEELPHIGEKRIRSENATSTCGLRLPMKPPGGGPETSSRTPSISKQLASLLRGKHAGIAFNAHFIADGAIVYRQACALGCEGCVEAPGLAVSFRPGGLLDKGQKPGGAGGHT